MCKVINDEITVSRKKSFCQAKNAEVIVEKLMPDNALQGGERKIF